MVLSIALIACYSLLGVISVVSYFQTSGFSFLIIIFLANVSETSVVLPRPPSMNPPKVHPVDS